MAEFRVLTLNTISARGLARLPSDRFEHGGALADPHAILVRSADLHAMDLPASLVAVGRAGAGTNNIPVARLSERGVPVFNAPGANANAVKELVLAGLLLAARNIAPALQFVQTLPGEDEALEQAVENGKKSFAGFELSGRTLAVMGLGRIGSLVADAAIHLGMHVVGYDPEITVEAAWNLPQQVRRAHSIDELLRHADFVTLHVPLVPATRGLMSTERLAQMKQGAVLLNFARDAIVDSRAVLQALGAKRLRGYVCDFPERALVGQPGVLCLPHLGASTREAEENCAVMVADTLRDFLDHGNIRHSVNFPEVAMAREVPHRVAIAHANVPNMLGQISTAMAQAGINIHNMLNKSRHDVAYTLVDTDTPVPAQVVDSVRAIGGVLSVRALARVIHG